MSKVLFVNPPMIFNYEKGRKKGTAPIRPNVSVPALLILGELKKYAYETFFIDMAAEGHNQISKIRKNIFCFGLGNDVLAAKIRQIKPTAVLISSLFLTNIEMVKSVARTVKETPPKAKVIVGGGFASEKPEWHLESKSIDFVVLGEGEEKIVKLLQEIKKENPNFESIKGIAFRKNGKIKIIKKAEQKPEFNPSFDYETVLFKQNNEYRYPEAITRKDLLYSHNIIGEQRACVFYGSRGCPMGCDYCSAFSREGRTIRHMGGKKLFEQIKLLHKKYQVNVFYNQADAFGLHEEDKKFLKLLAEYRKNNPEIALNNPNAFFVRIFFKEDKIDKEFILLLKDAGFNVITLAVETFNQRFNKKIDFSQIKFEKIQALCNFIRSQGMKIDIYMMYGFPSETIGELNNDLKKAKELQKTADEISWGFLEILPGSEYYKKAIKEKWFSEEEYRKKIEEGYSFSKINSFFNFSKIPPEKLKEIFEKKN